MEVTVKVNSKTTMNDELDNDSDEDDDLCSDDEI